MIRMQWEPVGIVRLGRATMQHTAHKWASGIGRRCALLEATHITRAYKVSCIPSASSWVANVLMGLDTWAPVSIVEQWYFGSAEAAQIACRTHFEGVCRNEL